MTMQVHERLHFRGEDCSLCSTPLAEAIGRVVSKPPFRGFSTACRRGYVGDWEIRDDQLFLIGLDPPFAFGTQGETRLAVSDLLPGAPDDGLLAAWCTDWLHVPKVEHMWIGFARSEPVTEWDIFLAVHRGKLLAVHEVTNYDTTTRELTPQLDETFPAEGPFIRAIHVNWAERLPRLVYADWLEERNDPRGELLRVDAALADAPEDAELLGRRATVLEAVKDWFWMKLVGCDPPRDKYGYEQRTW
jgi:uncharacterized protein (TIGR02996 family)